MLNQLPNETISKIVANLLHVDLNRLSLVSYRIRAITLPFLFRSLVFICPEGYYGKKTLLRLKGLAASNSVLPLVHRVTMSGSIRHTFLSPPPFDQYRPLMALTVAPYTLLLPLPNLHHLSLDNLPLDSAFLLALVNLARRRDIELYLTCCQVFIDTTPVLTSRLRIVTFAATREDIYDDAPGTNEDTIYHIISASSHHLRHLGLGSQLLNLIDRLLPTKFDSLRILQLEWPPKYTNRIFPSTLSKFLRRLGPLDNLILSPGLMVDPEIFLKGASGPPH